MIQYTDYVYYEGTNNPVVNAEVSVYIANTTTLANLFTDTGGATPKNNPVTTDQTGMFTFAAAGGTYDLYFLGVKQFQISLNDATGLPDPLTIQNLIVTGRGDFAELAVNTTELMPTAETKALFAGKVYIKDTNLTYPLPAYPSAAGMLMSGLTNQTTTYTCQIFSDVLTQVGAFLSLKNKLNGSLPTTGDILGRFSSGWTQSTGGSYTGVGMIAIATADIVQGVTHDTALYFTTMQGSGSATERMRISTPGNLLIGRSTDVLVGSPPKVQIIQSLDKGGLYISDGVVETSLNGGTGSYSAAHVVGTTYINSSWTAECHVDAAATGPRLLLLRQMSDGSLVNAPNMCLGLIQFSSATSTQTPAGAAIRGYSEDIWTNNVNTPGRIEFQTVPAGSNVLATRMTIKNDGIVLIGTTTALNPTAKLQVNGDIYASGSISAGSISYSNIDTTGNLTFTGTGQFIRGDMSNATASSRLTVQTSTTNGNTIFDIAPNGTGTASVINLYSSSTKSDTSPCLRLLIQPGGTQIVSGPVSGGTPLTLVLAVGNIGIQRLFPSGNMTIGGTTDNGYKLEVIGNLNVTGSITAGSLSYTSISTSGNLSFTAANSKVNLYSPAGFIGTASDTTFQNGTANANTVLHVAPNGTSLLSSVVVYGNSDIANAPYGGLTINGSAVTLTSAVTGTGTLRPLRFIMGSLGAKISIFTDGMVGINNPVNDGLNALQVKGTQSIVSTGFTVPFSLPAYGLKTVGETSSLASVTSWCFNDSSINGGRFLALRSTASGGYAPNGLMLGSLAFGLSSADGTAIATPGVIACHAEQQTSATAQGCSLRFSTTPLNATSLSLTERMRITSEGIVLVGSTTGVPVGAAKLQVTGDITATGSITAGSISYTNIDASGNLTFTATGQFIRGDMSNNTASSRLAFQSNTLNGTTLLDVVPNGTNTSTGITVFNSSDRANSGRFRLMISSTVANLVSNAVGTGTILPIDFTVGTTTVQRIHTSGNVSIGSTTDNGYKLEVVGTLKCTTLIADTFTLPSNPTFDTVTFSNTVSSPSANTLDHYAEGSFVAAINEMTGTPTGTWTYTRIGNVVTMSIPTLIGDVPNLRLTVSNIPAAIRPTVDRAAFVRTANNGFYDLGMVTVSPSGTLTFGLGANNDLYNGGSSSGIGITSFSYTL